MRKTKQEIEDRAILEEILSSAVICRMAMNDSEVPYLLPFNYGYRDGCIYIHSAIEGKKIDLLKKNPLVSFEVEDPVEIREAETACKWSTRYRSVIGKGKVEILSDESSKRDGLEVIMAQHGAPQLKDFDPKHMKHMVILKLTISSMTGKHSNGY